MAYVHTVVDSKGKMHKRTSAERQYAFAVVTHHKPWTHPVSGQQHGGYSSCVWSSRRDLAEAQARVYRNAEGVEIIACTPIGVGKHKQG